MSAENPFGLPDPLLDAAVAHLATGGSDDWQHALAALQAAHPEHADGLRQLTDSLREASRALHDTFHAAAPAAEPEFSGYRVLRKLGEGAFGVVYLGEQDEPVRREVAIKVLRPGTGDRGTLARFDAERRFLARLRHPAIAQIFGAGLLPDGRPWFVMEYVPGVPIADYCDRNTLSVAARLRLFARLCQGVHHAHEHGVVHRDLKPANILVIDVDGDAQPKIIDFGIARALEKLAEPVDARTETGRVVGTPGYMSPEQMAGDLAAIDARTDVWSLGVVLFELLVGELPWGKRPTSNDSDPPRPSSRVSTSNHASATTAQQRGSEPRRLAAQLRGELDWIVLKALSRERSGRYLTALDLAGDVLRHLRGEPVHAGPPSWRYRLRKFARRHRTAILAVTTSLGLGAGGVFAFRAWRDEAEARALAISDAADRLLERANDRLLLGKPGAEPVRQSLAEDALRFADELLRERPGDLRHRARRAKTLQTLAQVSLQLGRFEAAATNARAAAEDADAVLTANPDDGQARKSLAWAERSLGVAMQGRGQSSESLPHSQRAVELFERCVRDGDNGARHGLVRALSDTFVSLPEQTEPATKERLLRTASEVQEAILREYPEALYERDLYAHLLLRRCRLALQAGRLPEARALLEPVEAWLPEGQGLLPGTCVKVHENAALCAKAAGDLATARDRLDRAIVIAREDVALQPNSWTFRALGSALVERVDLSTPEQADARTRCLRELLTVGEQFATKVPDDLEASELLVNAMLDLCQDALIGGSRQDLTDLEAPARLAGRRVARLPTRYPPAAVRHRTLWTRGTLGLLADALGLPDADAIWDEVREAMTACSAADDERAAAAPMLAMFGLRIAARRIATGRDADADVLLEQVNAAIAGDNNLRASQAPVVARLQALLACRRGDFAAALDGIDELLDAGAGWRPLDAAAAAIYEIWQAASRANDAAANEYRDRTVQACTNAIEVLDAMPTKRDEVWIVMPLAKARVRRSLAAKARGDALPEDLAPALDTLQKWRDGVHANEWDEDLYRRGLALLGR